MKPESIGYIVCGLIAWCVIFFFMIAVYPITLIFLVVGIYSSLPELFKVKHGMYLKIVLIFAYLVLLLFVGQIVGPPALYDDLR